MNGEDVYIGLLADAQRVLIRSANPDQVVIELVSRIATVLGQAKAEGKIPLEVGTGHPSSLTTVQDVQTIVARAVENSTLLKFQQVQGKLDELQMKLRETEHKLTDQHSWEYNQLRENFLALHRNQEYRVNEIFNEVFQSGGLLGKLKNLMGMMGKDDMVPGNGNWASAVNEFSQMFQVFWKKLFRLENYR